LEAEKKIVCNVPTNDSWETGSSFLASQDLRPHFCHFCFTKMLPKHARLLEFKKKTHAKSQKIAAPLAAVCFPMELRWLCWWFFENCKIWRVLTLTTIFLESKELQGLMTFRSQCQSTIRLTCWDKWGFAHDFFKVYKCWLEIIIETNNMTLWTLKSYLVGNKKLLQHLIIPNWINLLFAMDA